VPAVTTRVLALHLALPYATKKLVALLAVLAYSAGAPAQIMEARGREVLRELRSQPWYIQAAALATPRSYHVVGGMRKVPHIVMDMNVLGEGRRGRRCARARSRASQPQLTPPLPTPRQTASSSTVRELES